MTKRTAEHATFEITRTFPAGARRVFEAFSNLERKRRWASCHPDWAELEHRMDFRVGGSEISRMKSPDGVEHVVEAHFLDVVPDERIVYAYDMRAGDQRISVSLVTIMLEGKGTKTQMAFTEQVVFLDALDGPASRRGGTESGFDRLEQELCRRSVSV